MSGKYGTFSIPPTKVAEEQGQIKPQHVHEVKDSSDASGYAEGKFRLPFA